MNEEIIKRMYAKEGMFKFVVGAPDGRGKGIAGQKNLAAAYRMCQRRGRTENWDFGLSTGMSAWI